MSAILFDDDDFLGFGLLLLVDNDHVPTTRPLGSPRQYSKYVTENPDTGRMWNVRFYRANIRKCIAEFRASGLYTELYDQAAQTYATVVLSPCHDFAFSVAPVLRFCWSVNPGYVHPGLGEWLDFILCHQDVLTHPDTQAKNNRPTVDGNALILSVFHDYIKVIQHSGSQKAFSRHRRPVGEKDTPSLFEVCLSMERVRFSENGVVLLDRLPVLPLGFGVVDFHLAWQQYHSAEHGDTDTPRFNPRSLTNVSLEALDEFPS